MRLTTDEKIIVNAMVQVEDVKKIDLEILKEKLVFSIEVSDDEMKPLVSSILEKVNNINEDEFEEIKMQIPFEVPYDFESNVDEVPYGDENLLN